MSQASPLRRSVDVLSGCLAALLLVPLLTLLVQRQHPALSLLACGASAALGLATLHRVSVRYASRAAALAAALQAERSRRETAEAALRAARKMEAVGRLTRGLAHDVNNHLTAISSNVELLARRLPPDAEPLHRLATAAVQGVQRAAALTHELLSFSRPHPLEPEPLDLGRLVAAMAGLLRRTLGESITVETVLADGLWLTWADANQVEAAVLHLATNARDAMPQGGTLTIETANAQLDDAYALAHPDVAAGPHVVLAVSCAARGGHAEAPLSDPMLPLACGHVSLGGAPGQAASVRLYLPRYQSRPARQVPANADRRRADAPGGETILVVEDDDSVRRSCVAALQSMGYAVLEAPDAMEGFRLIADRGGIDLLFTDVGLPGGVDGRALADAARNHTPGLRVLFTTGYADIPTGASPPGGPDLLFIPKPFTLEQLAAKVREALPAAAAPARANDEPAEPGGSAALSSAADLSRAAQLSSAAD